MTQQNEAVEAYIQTLPDKRQEDVSQLRALILDTLPEARETIAYGMPAVVVTDDEIVCSYKAQKHYTSLYMDVQVVADHAADLAALNCGKSCIRFRRYEQLPEEAIREMLRETAVKQKKTNTG
ncbi:MAG: DUF1801 domain-containing protein [Chloroflexi bacterium]|nr:DUF1801 domain-containing protein [Chloroflexota bacterium]